MSKRNVSKELVVTPPVVTIPSREELEVIVATVPMSPLKLNIKNESQYDKIMEAYKFLGSKSKELKAKKDSVLNPLKEAVKNFNALFKPYEDRITNAENQFQIALNAYVTAKEDARKAQLAKIENDKRLKNPVTIQSKLAVIEAKPEGTFKVKVVKVTDLTKIPLEYFDLNEARVKAAYAAGLTLPGVEVVEESRVRR